MSSRAKGLLLGAWFAVNLPLVVWTIQHNWLGPQFAPDWHHYELAVHRLVTGQALYDPTWTSGQPFLYSPVVAWVLVPLAALGYPLALALHAAALVVIREFWLVAAVAVSWPFWTDLTAGNLFGVVFALGVAALRGERWAEYGFLAASILMPRPVQLPLAAWLIWQRPQIRVAFVVMFVIHGVAVVLSGVGSEWLEVLQSTPGDQVGLGFNFALSRWLGLAWVPIGLAIGVICFWRGRLGLASLAISPYLLPSYLLAGFWEWRPRDPQ